MTDTNIYKDNQYEPDMDLTKKLPATGAVTAAVGQAGLTLFLSATRGGAAIHADLSLAAIERSGKPGTFYAVFPPAAINAHLFPAFDGKDVFVGIVSGEVPPKVKTYDRVKAFSVRPSA